MPALAAVVDSLDKIPEAARPFYTEKDGKHVLSIEGAPPGLVKAADLADANGKLAEFRENNRTLNTKVADLEGKLKPFDGIDPAEHQELKTKVAELEKKGVKNPDDVDAAGKKLLEPVLAQIKTLETQLADLGTREAAAQKALAQKELEGTLTQAGVKAGIDPRAMPDYLGRATRVFRVEDGKVVAKDGDTPLFSKEKGTEPLTPAEWAASLADDAPHLFKTSSGSGADHRPNVLGGPQHIDANDPLEFGRNAEKIAKGDLFRQTG